MRNNMGFSMMLVIYNSLHYVWDYLLGGLKFFINVKSLKENILER